MAQNAKSPSTAAPSNGVVTAANTRGLVGGNRKKQKRRAKQQAKAAQSGPVVPPPASEPYTDDDDADEDDHDLYVSQPPPHTNGGYTYAQADEATDAGRKKRNKKKKRGNSNLSPRPADPAAFINSALHHPPLPSPPPPPMSSGALRSVQRSAKQDRIWNTSTQEERERIKEFWLTLSEDERKSLLKIEKEAVLRKMKEQQKHSCSCTVCGRKRVAIEEELEVLYDAYYEELEQYANHQGGESILPPPRSYPPPHLHRSSAVPLPLSTQNSRHRTSRVHEIIDDEEDDEDDEGVDDGDSQDLSEDDDEDEEEEEEEEEEDDDEGGEGEEDDEDDEYSDDEDDMYSDDEDEPEDDMPRGIGADFFNFGNSLTVKGGILTVADDLLKNDGKKFIEMMEQLAERRMQREQEAEYASSQPSHQYQSNGHEPPLDDEEYDDDEDDYDSQDDYDDEEEEEDEMVMARDKTPSGGADSWQGGMSEEQRMEEGRRMFQIFAARMFEQRVLTAYREKVAAERQKKLLEELEDESKLDAEREAKKARDAEKRKNKKLAQKQAKAEEKARKEAEKAAEEAAARAIEEKKQEEARRRKEEQRKKKEAERRAHDEERQRKEAERLKRQQDERDRQQEAERRLREQKALEKKQRDEARKKEREEREAKEKDAREKKADEERARREREARARAERDAARTQQQQQHAGAPAAVAKRPSQASMVAVPPGLLSRQSPHVSVATPALPKAPAPAHAVRRSSHQGPHQGPHAPSPQVPHAPAMAPTKSTSPGGGGGLGHSTPRSILQKSQAMQLPQQTSPVNQLPPPGMHPQAFGAFPPSLNGFPGFHAAHSPMMPAMGHRPSLPGFSQPHLGGHFQPFHSANSIPPPPPGMAGLGMIAQGRGFPADGHAGFQQQMPQVTSPTAPPGFGLGRHSIASHSRTHSSEKTNNLDSTGSPAPISRPTPIQRPSSVKPTNADVDDLSKHLGSSALLDDADDPLPTVPEGRRQSAVAGHRSGPMGFGSPVFAPSQTRMDAFSANSSWSSPSMFGVPPGLGAPSSSWGANINTGGWPSTPFGTLGHRPSGANRPLTIRLAVCQACKQLAAREPTPDNYHPVDSLLRQIDVNHPLLEAPVTLKEIEDICETEGDAQNGGGLLHVRRDGGSPSFSVKFEQDAGTPKTGRAPQMLGEIGSPMPGHSVPAFGGGGGGGGNRGFQSLGSAMATPNLS